MPKTIIRLNGTGRRREAFDLASRYEAAIDMTEVLLLEPNGDIPNNPRLPVLIYRGAFSPNAADMAADMEKTFAENGWPPQWRDGIYDFHHYHCEGHEVLGIAGGSAELVLGGPDRSLVRVSAGDVLLLPAGTGHCCRSASEDFLVIGAYPPGQRADIQRQAASETMKKHIEQLPFPDVDPVLGSERPLSQFWTMSSG